MKTREQKQKDLEALTQQFQEATAAMLIGFNKLTVTKDQELRRQLDQAGAKYSVVKNTLARHALEGRVEVRQRQPGSVHVQGWRGRRQSRRASGCRSYCELAFEGSVDLEGHVPDQLSGAAARDGSV